MYCTISASEPSSGTLSPDARRSYESLGRNADLLAGLSASFAREARSAAEAYRAALHTAAPDAWAQFVEAADVLTRHMRSVDGIVPLSPREQNARAFFEQIVVENGDLLNARVPALV